MQISCLENQKTRKQSLFFWGAIREERRILRPCFSSILRSFGRSAHASDMFVLQALPLKAAQTLSHESVSFF